MGRLGKILDAEPEIRDTPETDHNVKGLKGAIEFRNVTFTHRGAARPSLEEISLTIPAGSTTAIVGYTGSGKSTLVNLIPRFFDPTDGRILLDGTDIREVTLRSLRAQIGMVTQETILFDDTVSNNIAYGRGDVSAEQIAEAARLANAHEFILGLPDGYQTRIGERGVRLSGGQRQRLAIARAILKDPPILILDEATSSLDAESERLVQEALDRVMAHRTTFVIAHRLSTILRADTILVLKDGAIVETGTHGALLARQGVYAQLYELQLRAAEVAP